MVYLRTVIESLRLASLAIVQAFWIFCENSSLHGLRYIGRSGASRANYLLRLVWGLFSLVGLGFTLMLTLSAWEQFRSNPTLTTIETTTFPVSMIPFPSVTLCNINKIHSGKAKELSNRLIELGLSDNDTQDLLYALPRLNDYRPVAERMLRIENFLRAKGYDTERLAFEVAPTCESMLVHCFWLMQPVPCSKLFRRTKMYAGYCCSFNVDSFLEPASTRSKERSPSKNIYVTGIGKGEGLSVLLDIGEAYYTASNRFTYGIEVFVHQSFDFPDASDYTAIVQRGMETDVSALPVIVSASPALRDVPLNIRGCAFSDEGNMTEALPYTFSNCMIECEQRYIAKICKCIPLFKQVVELQAILQVPICGFHDLPCLTDVKEHTLFTSEAVNVTTQANYIWTNVKCRCYPACTVEKNDLLSITNTIANPRKDQFIPELNFSAYGSLHVHFRSTNCLKYRREPFLTWKTLVATFGGIFGLCMGGSILSLVEMLYHFGITPFVVYSELRKKILTTAVAAATPNDAVASLDYPRRPPIGYFRRSKVMAREMGASVRAGWLESTDQKRTLSQRWKQRYIDEFNMMA
ncbi:sodium channel protein Nach-like [Anopheles darlingi]|uniref:sodium channel protein Nach-like n=1 Tax=Anopheles darlingi TaxID=43151 RepID=UPI0021004A66|nr:sodium channel protein Nach-like [Anopheles darlingi]